MLNTILLDMATEDLTVPEINQEDFRSLVKAHQDRVSGHLPHLGT